MKVDFRKIEITDIEGNVKSIDVSKELGNAIYRNTPDLGELDFAQEIYRKGEVEIDESRKQIIKKYMDVGKFLAYIKRDICKLLDKE